MNLGRELVASALREGTIKHYLDGGINRDWLSSTEDPSRSAIFSDDEDMAAWKSILSHWDKHHKVPSVEAFRRSFPESAYKLPQSKETPSELLEIFGVERRRMLAELTANTMGEMLMQNRHEEAADFMATAARIIRETHQSTSTVVDWDSDDYDLEGRINRTLTEGVYTGIDGFDKQDGFFGFQPGSLTCYLGRAKAGKTSFALLSAIRAWRDGMRVLFLSFEIAAGKDPNEPGIADRLDGFAAEIDALKYMQGRLKGTPDADKLRRFKKEHRVRDRFKIVQPSGKYSTIDLAADIERFEPDVVFVDGFYFMVDHATGKPGSQWEGHDNLASDLKALAMNRMIPIVITHQVREKQLTGKKGAGIDDGAMMGGTAIIMFADLVIGVDTDPETQVRTLSCTRSRLHYLATVHGEWEWETCTFSEREDNPFDQEAFGYESGGAND